eukprot:3542591-Alexandrium_andersonii.AAC.1
MRMPLTRQGVGPLSRGPLLGTFSRRRARQCILRGSGPCAVASWPLAISCKISATGSRHARATQSALMQNTSPKGNTMPCHLTSSA